MCSTKIIREKITLTKGGCTQVALYPASATDRICSYYVVEGTETLTSAFEISPSGDPRRFRYVNILWNADVTVGAFGVTIFGQQIPQSMLDAGKFIIQAWYDGTDWVVSPMPIGVDGSVGPEAIDAGAVLTEKLADNAVTLDKMEHAVTAQYITYDATGAPVRNTITGDVVIDENGVATIQALQVVDAMIFDLDASKLTGTMDPARLADDSVGEEKLDEITLMDYLFTQAATPASTVETVLWSHTIPAGYLAADGEAVRVTAYLYFNNTVNIKTLKLKADGNVVVQNLTTTAPQDKYCEISAIIMRAGATSSVCKGKMDIEGVDTQFGESKAGITWANAVDLEITGQENVATGNEILIDQVVLERLR